MSLLLLRVLMAGLLGSTALLLVPIDGLSSGTFGMFMVFFFGKPSFFLMGVRFLLT
jgi:hypothetical protein